MIFSMQLTMRIAGFFMQQRAFWWKFTVFSEGRFAFAPEEWRQNVPQKRP
jgi:hypothetical protein